MPVCARNLGDEGQLLKPRERFEMADGRNTASWERIIYAVLHHLNASWSLVPSHQSTRAS